MYFTYLIYAINHESRTSNINKHKCVPYSHSLQVQSERLNKNLMDVHYTGSTTQVYTVKSSFNSRTERTNIMKFTEIKKTYNLQHVLQIFLYICPFPRLHDGDVE